MKDKTKHSITTIILTISMLSFLFLFIKSIFEIDGASFESLVYINFVLIYMMLQVLFNIKQDKKGDA